MKVGKNIIEEVKPFLGEWKSLSEGEIRPVKIGKFVIKVRFFWESDNTPDYEIIGCYNDDAFLMEKVIPQSNSCKMFEKRIKRFIKKTSNFGIKYHNQKDYLWDNYFWLVDP